mgnify:CR=1 FL=1
MSDQFTPPDAGTEELFAQLFYLMDRRFPDVAAMADVASRTPDPATLVSQSVGMPRKDLVPFMERLQAEPAAMRLMAALMMAGVYVGAPFGALARADVWELAQAIIVDQFGEDAWRECLTAAARFRSAAGEA